MTRSKNKNRGPWPNNSGVWRQPTNVWWVIHKSDGSPMLVRTTYYENELTQLADDYPNNIIFVCDEDLEE